MDHENKYASNAKGNTGVTLGAVALGTALLGGNNGILGNLLGGCGNGCSEDHYVNRYEIGLQQEIAAKDSKISLLESSIYVDSKLADIYERLDGKIRAVESQIAQQAVKNAQIEGTFAVIGEQQNAMRNEFMCALKREKDERCCGDNAIVNYANATFYPKLVANVTAGTETTAQSVYNPLPNYGCGC